MVPLLSVQRAFPSTAIFLSDDRIGAQAIFTLFHSHRNRDTEICIRSTNCLMTGLPGEVTE